MARLERAEAMSRLGKAVDRIMLDWCFFLGMHVLATMMVRCNQVSRYTTSRLLAFWRGFFWHQQPIHNNTKNPKSITRFNMQVSFALTASLFLTGVALSSAQLASINDGADSSLSTHASSKAKNGSECPFTNGFKVEAPRWSALGCGFGEVCIEDEASSLGGRCQKEELMPEMHRHLTDCTYNNGTTTGVKCNGTDACANVTDMSGIGCGSWWVAFSVIDPSFYPNTHACTVLLQQWQWCVYICRWDCRGEQLVSVFFMEKVNMSLYSYTNVLTTLLQQ